MHNYIEKEKIAEYAGNYGNSYNIYNFIPPSLHFVNCTNTFRASKIQDKRNIPGNESSDTEVPLVLSIKRVCKRR
jgi:hypothetical protein